MARKYTDLVIYLTNDPVFESQFEDIFNTTDVDNDGILNADEWVDFCRTTCTMIKNKSPQISDKLLNFDAGTVRKFYYAFNMISNDHSGISMQKLVKAKQMYYYATLESTKLMDRRQWFGTFMWVKFWCLMIFMIAGIFVL